MSILKSFEAYISRHHLDTTPEQMFLEFKMISDTHRQFDQHLKTNGIDKKLAKMRRSQRLKEKRKLFADWYTLMNQDKKRVNEIVSELSEMVFMSTRTVENDIYTETTV